MQFMMIVYKAFLSRMGFSPVFLLRRHLINLLSFCVSHVRSIFYVASGWA